MVMLSAWGLELFPLTPDKIRALGPTLRVEGYRAFANYLSLFRVEAERAGQGQIRFALGPSKVDAERRCEGGFVQPKQCLKACRWKGCPHFRMTLSRGPPGSFCGPDACLSYVGTWWLFREIEVSSSRLDDVRVSHDGIQGAKSATWFLSASRTDAGAAGAER